MISDAGGGALPILPTVATADGRFCPGFVPERQSC
jgi:hypothetical protein